MAFIRYPEGREPDYDRSGVIDRNDVAIMAQALNQPAGPGDPRDLDHDGRITALDARKLALRCDYPTCAPGLPPRSEPEIYFIHTDPLGTPRMLTDPMQTPVWRWDSDPFGTTPATEDPDGDGIPFVYHGRFPGQYYDGETGLHYNLNRYYDPSVGRYRESDPIGLEGGINTYAYVENNPINWIDPLGLLGSEGAVSCFGCYGLPDWLNPLPAPIKPEPYETRKRGQSDPIRLPIIRPGRDCNGNCNPCPPGVEWWEESPGHGHSQRYKKVI